MACLSSDLAEIQIKPSGRTYLPDPDLVLPTASVGVEVELEQCSRVLKDTSYPTSQYWLVATDGSLRDNGLEFKTNGPVFGEDLVTALTLLQKSCYAAKPQATYRTSVHIHLDIRDMSLSQLIKMTYLYIVFERSLFRLHPNRSSNRYCLPLYSSSVDADRIGVLQHFLEKEDKFSSNVCQFLMSLNKYSAYNISRIPTFGTVEFRHMNGTYDSAKILSWINLIFCLKRATMYDSIFSIDDMPSRVSSMSPISFSQHIFGKHFHLIDYPDLIGDIYEGVRLADFIRNHHYL